MLDGIRIELALPIDTDLIRFDLSHQFNPYSIPSAKIEAQSLTFVRGNGNPKRMLEKERRERLSRAMMRLSPQERYCLDLRAEGLSYREIAEAPDIGISSVNTFLGRGLMSGHFS